MNQSAPNVRVLHDLVMIRPMPLHLKKSSDGIILPGDIDLQAPKRATILAAGPGTYDKSGKFIPNPFKPGDQVLYMSKDLIAVKVEGEEFIMLKAEDVILKFGVEELEQNDTLPEMSDAAYVAEGLRRKLIQNLEDAGLVRVQDMLNPVENFISSDGETVVATARSFLIDKDSLSEPFTPAEGDKAFTMLKINYTVVDNSVKVYARLAFLPRADVTLG